MPLVLLHGGWGYEVYGFDSQVEQFQGLHRIVAPDRSGFGRSTKVEALPDEFHKAAAIETLFKQWSSHEHLADSRHAVTSCCLLE